MLYVVTPAIIHLRMQYKPYKLSTAWTLVANRLNQTLNQMDGKNPL